MAIPRGKTRKIILMVGEIEDLVAKAVGNIDTKNQFEIRSFLEKALDRCFEIRNMYDPISKDLSDEELKYRMQTCKNNIETYKALTGETGGGYTRKQLAMIDRLKSILDERRN